MRITKDLATQIAIKLTEKHRETYKAADKAANDYVRAAYMESVPALVTSFKYLEYINTTNRVYVSSAALNTTFYVSPEVPSNSGHGVKIVLSNSQADTLQKLMYAAKDADIKARGLKQEIINTLLALRTFKTVREQFPEASEHLPNDNTVSTALIPDLSKLRNQLK